jgi:hypothetical protein
VSRRQPQNNAALVQALVDANVEFIVIGGVDPPWRVAGHRRSRHRSSAEPRIGRWRWSFRAIEGRESREL